MPTQSININTNATPTINHSIVFNDSKMHTTAIPNNMKQPNKTTNATAKHNASNLLILLILLPPQIVVFVLLLLLCHTL
ncbi:zinc protease [Enterococcus phage EFRM31]|uniref:zinc protease n=1 Tax=Enterococcus phage EFRM31 TaxID=767806 RepID=UPI0001D9923A|nr:zinc protease [Enterococcus phage EFRM31]ADI23901.1 zinc protease [Enterococcus phage EFRM31]